MIQIFDAPRTGFDFLAEDAPKLGASIAELVAKIKKSKQISEMAKQMAEKSGNPEAAELYKQLAMKDPAALLKEMGMQNQEKEIRSRRQQGGAAPGSDLSSGDDGVAQPGLSGQTNQRQQGEPQQRPFSQEEIELASIRNPQKGAMMQRENDTAIKQQKMQTQSFENERKYQTKLLGDAPKKMSGLRDSLDKKKNSLALARDAIESGDVGSFSKNALANFIGGAPGDALRTAKGSQLITAAKENLLSNISRVSSKGQNIWFEQRLNSMFPKIGQTREANLSVQEMLESEVALDEAYLKKYDQLEKEDMDRFGYIKADIERRAHQEVKPEEKQIMQRTFYRLKELEEQESSPSSMKRSVGKKVSKGTPLTISMAKLYVERYKTPDQALKAAKQNGYYIPTAEEARQYQARPNEFFEDQ